MLLWIYIIIGPIRAVFLLLVSNTKYALIIHNTLILHNNRVRMTVCIHSCKVTRVHKLTLFWIFSMQVILSLILYYYLDLTQVIYYRIKLYLGSKKIITLSK